MKFLKALCFTSIGLLAPAVLLAHTELTASNPANGAVLDVSPPTIDLSFTEAVQLLRLIVTDSGGKEAPTEFSPSAAAQKNFATVLPVLAQDTYTVNWTVLGDDGHRVENSFTFSVDATATETTGAVTEPHTGDGH